ncbi:MFS transporter [Knoellia subterranea]|uniref:MFS transporter n=1 Tax=Knoellia subterranea KCTC 19937 TaxID=1385521 RepID=A0A0A0JIG3_9MICO|nr:MFS transporter [Knoellia subterranea]KGN37195.1 MFS transporter [Knoellia subterranea KCTC 19937]
MSTTAHTPPSRPGHAPGPPPENPAAAPTVNRPGPLAGLALAVFATAQLMLVLDVTVVNVALPHIGTDLGIGRAVLPWVMTIYTLCFGGLMLAGGRVADRFGARRVALVGLVGFIAASALAGLATGTTTLLLGRALQGVAAAFLSPAALAAALAFHPGQLRARAMSVWAALAGTGAALGVILGGVVVAQTSWRWIFGINVPIGLALLATILLRIPAAASRPVDPASPTETSASRRIDLPGALLITATTASAIYGLTVAGTDGWLSLATGLALAAAAVLAGLFVIVERRTSEPLLDARMFTRRPVLAGAFLMLVATGLLVGAFFVGSFAMQHAHGLGALATGLAFLPTAIGTIVGAHLAGHVLERVSARVVAPVGFGLAAIGYAGPVLSDRLAFLVAGLGVAAAGLGMLFVTAFTASLGDATEHESGLRSAVVNTFHELGGAAGVAVLSSVAGAVLVAARPSAGDFTSTFTVGAAIAVVGGVVSLGLVPRVLRPSGVGTGHH